MPENWSITVTKAPLKSLVKEPDKVIPILSNYLKNSNTIVTLGFLFIRLYVLSKFDRGDELPNISGKFCENVLTVVSHPDKTRTGTLLALKDFYHESFKNLICPDLEIDPGHLSTVLQSNAKSMKTALHNNISVHFLGRLRKAVILQLKARAKFSQLERKHLKFIAKHIVDALWDKDPSELPEPLLEVYQTCLERYIPQEKYEKCLGYDLEAHTQNYLKPTLTMNKDFEDAGWKTFQPLSLRNTAIPKHITIDTKTLIYLFNFTDLTQYNKGELLKKYRQNDLYDLIWRQIFRMDKKVFRRSKGDKNTFLYVIETDGISISVKFIRKNQLSNYRARYDKKNQNNQNNQKENKSWKKQVKEQTKKKPKRTDPKDRLLTEYSQEEIDELKHRNQVYNDPGLFILLHMVDQNGTTLRYTRRQRENETYSKKNRKIRQQMKKHEGINEIEKSLNEFNKKTMDPFKFSEFIKAKLKILCQVQDHYSQEVYRKNNLRKHIYTKKSEDRLLKKIGETFGEDSVIYYGNWSRTTTHMKNSPPVPQLGMCRTIQRKFKAPFVDEFKTSSVCPWCDQKLVNKEVGKHKIHRCLVCEGCCSLKNGSKVRFIQRDIVGSLNIGRIVRAILNQEERPKALARDNVKKKRLLMKSWNSPRRRLDRN